MGIVVREVRRADPSVVTALGDFGVATIHEAQGRTGLLQPGIRPIFPGARVSGSAVTVGVPPDDNLMIHVAVEQCRDGDVLVVAPTAPSDAGYLGELLATALQARGVRGVVIDAGVRDVAELHRMGFPVWSRCISALGTVKETLGDVNVPIVCAGQGIRPGDVVVADDDGVVIVRREDAPAIREASAEREEKEAASRRRYEAGELSLDVHSMREGLEARGLRYVDEVPDDASGDTSD
jgi:4-hydroxy-4-methyl-2-oxoglutarate aldolase